MEKVIRVLYFMDGIGNAGGIQEMVINWLTYFDHNRIIVDILSYDTGKQDNYTERFEKFGGKIYMISTFAKKGQFKKSLKETKKFFNEHNDYDIVHAHASSKAFFVLREAKKHGIKVRIIHSHCTQFVNRSKKSLIIGNILKPLTNIISTHYFACSHEAGYFLFGKKRMDKKGIYIPNGINLEEFNYDSLIEKKIKEKLGISKKIVIGNIGRFRPQKNHTFLIDVFKEVLDIEPNSVLVLVGTGELFDDIKAKVDKLNINQSVLFLGYRNDVKEVAQAFDVLVMPSLFEGLPVTSVEAEALGVPCIFSNNITKDAAIIPNCKFLPLKNYKKWAKYILETANTNKCLNAHEYLKDKGFDIKDSSKKIYDTYVDILKLECRKKD